MSIAAVPAAPPVVTFDESRWLYVVDGRGLPGITSRLKACGLIDDVFFSEESARRGTAVHLLTQYVDEGDLELSSIDARLVPYANAWERFKADTCFTQTHEPELPVASVSLGYGTRIDRVGTVTGTLPDRRLVVNLKSGAAQPWHALQLAGEAIAYSETYGVRLGLLERATVQLRPDGTYRFNRYEDRRDFDVWRGVALLAGWKEAHHA